ncbi:hypothetical protein HDU93_007554 [Gonapodya sp. JEL0774]|nr:hypothetical protein HDU93_007554 [Gonapodya sp. JEL0774]
MKPKRAKVYKRHMMLYKQSFGFREPYQVIRAFCGVYTPCTLNEIRLLGPQMAPVASFLRSLERRHCPHAAQPLQAAACIEEVIGPENKHRYCVGTQDGELKRKLGAIGATPLVYIYKSAVLLDGPSAKTFDLARQIEAAKGLPSSHENPLLVKKVSKAEKKKEKKALKRKRPKGPNPLSVKKKAKKRKIDGNEANGGSASGSGAAATS